MLWKKEPRKLPESLTSYDLLKSFALITMVIDHIGFYLFPDQIEWRIVGRMSLPIWLFLVGYACTREITPLLLGAALLLIFSDIVLGRAFFPLKTYWQSSWRWRRQGKLDFLRYVSNRRDG